MVGRHVTVWCPVNHGLVGMIRDLFCIVKPLMVGWWVHLHPSHLLVWAFWVLIRGPGFFILVTGIKVALVVASDNGMQTCPKEKPKYMRMGMKGKCDLLICIHSDSLFWVYVSICITLARACIREFQRLWMENHSLGSSLCLLPKHEGKIPSDNFVHSHHGIWMPMCQCVPFMGNLL